MSKKDIIQICKTYLDIDENQYITVHVLSNVKIKKNDILKMNPPEINSLAKSKSHPNDPFITVGQEWLQTRLKTKLDNNFIYEINKEMFYVPMPTIGYDAS